MACRRRRGSRISGTTSRPRRRIGGRLLSGSIVHASGQRAGPRRNRRDCIPGLTQCDLRAINVRQRLGVLTRVCGLVAADVPVRQGLRTEGYRHKTCDVVSDSAAETLALFFIFAFGPFAAGSDGRISGVRPERDNIRRAADGIAMTVIVVAACEAMVLPLPGRWNGGSDSRPYMVVPHRRHFWLSSSPICLSGDRSRADHRRLGRHRHRALPGAGTSLS